MDRGAAPGDDVSGSESLRRRGLPKPVPLHLGLQVPEPDGGIVTDAILWTYSAPALTHVQGFTCFTAN